MADLPTGTVTLLFTDIEGSTRLLQQQGERYGSLLAEYRDLLRSVFASHGGHEVDTQGDSFFVVFPRAVDAVTAAVAAQRAIAAHPWPEGVAFRTRMGLHTGEPQVQAGTYVGIDVHRAARLMAAGHGGQVVLSDATRAVVGHDLPSGVALRDLGTHRLKDLPHPEHVFQIVIPDLPSDFPSLKSLDARPNNLPVQLTSFVGREREVAALCARLRDPEVRLLTLTAPGGAGKTRLAVQVAADLLDDFPDGVWFVDLAPISDPALVAAAIAQPLGVQEVAGQPLVETLMASLREKRLLLLLDNFEQVIAAAGLVADLLKAAPTLKVLVTSRIVLHVYGEQEYPVPPLDLPDLKRLPPVETLSQFAAVALFIQRAQAVKPDFQVTNENALAVAEICARLDGLPLAIELAAARVKLFQPQALLARLDQRLKTLTGGARDLPARQQTLRGAIEWSYNLLDLNEQTLFRWSGVFVGGWTLEAAEAVCRAETDLQVDVLDGLASLVDKSLVRQVEGADGAPRFNMLETLREYALEQLAASGEAEALREQHARHYLTLVEAVQAQFHGAHQGVSLDQVAGETDNLAAALRWVLERDEIELGLRLFQGEIFWWGLGLSGIWNAWRDVLKSKRDSLPPALRAKALTLLGRTAWTARDYAVAVASLEEGLALHRDVDDKVGIAETLWYLADVHRDLGAYSRAGASYQESLALFQALADQHSSAWVYHSWGELALLQDDFLHARELEQASLVLFRALGQNVGVALSLVNQGLVAHAQGNDDRATQLYRESLLLARTLEAPWLVALGLVGVAGTALKGQSGSRCPQGAERATRLLAATEAVYEGNSDSMSQAHRREFDRAAATARSQLDEATWAAAWAEGRAMTLEQAITYALEQVS